jgi:hypothetical protein
MTKTISIDGKVNWKMRNHNIVHKDGVDYTFVDREIQCQEFAPDVFA